MCLCDARAPSFSLTVGLGLRVLADKAGEAGGRREPTPPRLRYIDWMPRAARHRSAPTALTRAVGQARMLFEAAHIEPNQTRICVAFTEAGASTGESQKGVHAQAQRGAALQSGTYVLPVVRPYESHDSKQKLTASAQFVLHRTFRCKE
jgi:hypothetical protein